MLIFTVQKSVALKRTVCIWTAQTDDWQMSDEVWYDNALNAHGAVTFNDPAFDIMTKTLCATVAKSVPLGEKKEFLL